jgi:predicted homoserine dehydrogenase-like protein
MIIVDRALEEREQEQAPIRVAIVGAGYMGRGVALEMLLRRTGMRLVAVANRTLAEAERAFRDAGVATVRSVGTLEELEGALEEGVPAATEDSLSLCRCEGIDVIVEATGEVEVGARTAVEAIAHGKHVVLMNAELDATIGPILKQRADAAGVVVTDTDGDEPGVAMNLYRYVRSLGFEPVLAGNIKGFIDRHRTPATQAEFAARHNQKPPMITSFADGTKLSMEATILANATGFGVTRRGMEGPSYPHVRDMVDGPLYLWYQPWHLPNFDLPLTVARAALFGDPAVTPLGAPRCEVVTVAKRDLPEGQEFDGIGGFDGYGTIENATVARAENLLPFGLAKGCRLTRAVAIDEPVSFGDVELPPDRLVDELWNEQLELFTGAVASR